MRRVLLTGSHAPALPNGSGWAGAVLGPGGSHLDPAGDATAPGRST